MAILGVDVGGTFTDAVLLTDENELRTAKIPTARRQEESVLAAAAAVGADQVERFAHGTTVATNALPDAWVAIAYRGGREIARALRVEHTIHREDGQIAEKNSYGADPCPPKDGR